MTIRARHLDFAELGSACDWPLLESLIDFGADECTFTILLDGGKPESEGLADAFIARLEFASLSEAVREVMSTATNEWHKPVPRWRFDRAFLKALRDVQPQGVFFTSWSDPVIVEDFIVYRNGEILFGTVTHEGHASIRMTDAEWARWSAYIGVSSSR